MKRWIMMAVIFFVWSFAMLESSALAAGEDYSNPIQLAENKSFSVTLESGYKRNYFTFTPQRSDLYAIECEANCTFYITRYTESWEYIDSTWMDPGEDRCVLGQLTKGTADHFSITSYHEQLSLTASISITQPFSYEVLSDGTASITDFALKGDIVIPGKIDGYTVTNLAECLFYGEDNITSVYLPATVSFFGSSSTSVDFDYVFSYCYDLVSITVDPQNKAYKSVDGVLYTKDGGHLVNYPCARPGESYHTNAQVLSCTSFASCRNLKELYLDNRETCWMGFTFYNTPNLTTYYIPGGYTEICALDFMDSHSGDSSWCTFQPWNNVVPDFKLPAKLTVIESGAFAGIRNVVIDVPDSVKRIERGAFDQSVTLYCSKNSAAEKYCNENGLKCILK